MSTTVDMEKIKRRWRRGWEAKKDIMIEKIQENAEVWKAGSLATEDKWANEVKKAAEEKRRAKALARVDPREWARLTAQGIQKTTLTDEDANKMARRAGPYISLIRQVRIEFKKIAFPNGIEAGRWWLNNVSELLKQAKGNPEKIPEIRDEIMRRIEAAKAQYGTIEVGVTAV